MATPQHTPALGVMKFTNLVAPPYLNYHILSLSVPCLGVEKTILKEKMHFQNIHVTCMVTP